MTEQKQEDDGRFDDTDLNEEPKNAEEAAQKKAHQESKEHRPGHFDDKDQ